MKQQQQQQQQQQSTINCLLLLLAGVCENLLHRERLHWGKGRTPILLLYITGGSTPPDACWFYLVLSNQTII
jgi:hypothetical protein